MVPVERNGLSRIYSVSIAVSLLQRNGLGLGFYTSDTSIRLLRDNCTRLTNDCLLESNINLSVSRGYSDTTFWGIFLKINTTRESIYIIICTEYYRVIITYFLLNYNNTV